MVSRRALQRVVVMLATGLAYRSSVPDTR